MTPAFWSWQLVFATLLNCVVVSLTIGAYASRLAGARSGRVATAISLFNLFSTAGRLAGMLYTPILGALADDAGLSAQTPAAAAAVSTFAWQLRVIVLGGAAGAMLGSVFLPTFVMLYVRAIDSFERRGSVPSAAMRLLRPRTLASTLRAVRTIRLRSIGTLSARNVPKNVLVLNALVTSVYGIGVTAAAYASVLHPAAARTALLSSGLINGFATIAYNVVVDPTSALVTDKVVKGERSIDDVRALVAYLSFSAIVGFLLSQLLLVPCANALVWASAIVTGR